MVRRASRLLLILLAPLLFSGCSPVPADDATHADGAGPAGASDSAAASPAPAVTGKEQATPLAAIPRRLAKEPDYTSPTPLYGLMVLGPKAATHIWLVLDKSAADAESYDVLYADLNADGDLTADDERLTAANAYAGASFRLPDVTDPATGDVHTDVMVDYRSRVDGAQLIGLRWKGERRIGGGYPVQKSDGYMRFAASPAEAPMLWVNGDGPFGFQRWIRGPLTIGGETDFKVFLGVPGIGPSSFCAFEELVLPADEAVLGKLIYRDASGAERQCPFRLEKRC
jgi:hypothetical protein